MKKVPFYIIVILLLIAVSLTLRIKVNNLTMNIQETEWRMNELKAENLELKMNIQKLKTRDSVMERLNDPDLAYNPDNVVVIK